ncbi:unnamed protein product, partial [Staurois parvus]
MQSNTSSMLVLTGERPVLFTYRPLPCQCWRGISSRDSVINSCRHQW